MDPDPLRLLETAPPLRSSTLSANPANSRFSVREDRRLASSEAVNKIPQKTLTDQLRSLVLESWSWAGVDFADRIHQSLSTKSTPHHLYTYLRGRDENDGLPNALHTEINQAGANQNACDQKKPVNSFNRQAEQDYNYSKQNTCCCGPRRERIADPRFFRGVYVGRISDREDEGQEKHKNPNELEADRRYR